MRLPAVLAAILALTMLLGCPQPGKGKITYQILETRDASYLGVKRVSAKISVKPGLPRATVQTILQHAASKIQERDGASAAIIHAYRSDGGTSGAYNVGTATRAPNGKWENANGDGPMQTVVVLQDSYFRQETPMSRFGLSEDEREKVFREIVAAEERADREASAKLQPSSRR